MEYTGVKDVDNIINDYVYQLEKTDKVSKLNKEFEKRIVNGDLDTCDDAKLTIRYFAYKVNDFNKLTLKYKKDDFEYNSSFYYYYDVEEMNNVTTDIISEFFINVFKTIIADINMQHVMFNDQNMFDMVLDLITMCDMFKDREFKNKLNITLNN